MSLWDIVKSFDARLLLTQVRMLETAFRIDPRSELAEEVRENLQSIFKGTAQDCKSLELTASRATAEKIARLLSKKRFRYEEFRGLATELEERIADEIAAPRFFALTLSETGYYSDWAEKWEEIIGRFPEAGSDVEEMSKCFALSRYAGAVFHSVQVIEHGLVSLGDFLSVKDRKVGWTATSNELRRIVASDPKKRTAFENQHFSFIEQMHGLVEALKNAWRHKIGHATGRLAVMSAEFGPEIAEEIIYATRAFMRRLATELPPVP